MSNTRLFSDFNSPDAGTTEGGTTEAGVILTDTLEGWREKTNGIIEKVNELDNDIDLIRAGGLNVHSLAFDKIVEVNSKRLLGNIGSSTDDVAEIEIDVTDSGLQDSDDTIPTSKAVKDYIDAEVAINAIELNQIAQVSGRRLLGNTNGTPSNVAQIEIDVDASGLQNSDVTIPTSKAVRSYVDSEIEDNTTPYIAASVISNGTAEALHGCSVTRNSTGQYTITVDSGFQIHGNNQRYVVNATIALTEGLGWPGRRGNFIQDVYTISTFRISDTEYGVRIYELESYSQDFSDDANNVAMVAHSFRDVPFQFSGVVATDAE